MVEQKDLDRAKKAYDTAWAQAAKYGQEAFEALKMAEITQARDSHDIFTKQAKRALTAYENWRKSAALAQNVIDDYYKHLNAQLFG